MRNNWVIQERRDGQWHDVVATERFAEAVKHLSPERRICRNGKVLRPLLSDQQQALLGTGLETPDTP